jgi:hypothetical protein
MVRVNKNLLAKLFWEAEDHELRLRSYSYLRVNADRICLIDPLLT